MLQREKYTVLLFWDYKVMTCSLERIVKLVENNEGFQVKLDSFCCMASKVSSLLWMCFKCIMHIFKVQSYHWNLEGHMNCIKCCIINRNLYYGEFVGPFNNTPSIASCRFVVIMRSCLTLSLPVLHCCEKQSKRQMLLVLRDLLYESS